MKERSGPNNGSPGRRNRLVRRQGAVVSAAGLALLIAAASALAIAGDLTQPTGTSGCVSETGAGPCADGHALKGADTAAVTADGKNVYAVSQDSNALVRFTRNTTTGAITEPTGAAGCISETGAGPCADGHALSGPFSVAVSADGKSVYVVSLDSNAVARFTRNTTTGALTQPTGAAGCISETGAGPCADGHGLTGADSVTVSSDGKNVYVTSHDAVVRLTRNVTTGAITEPTGAAGCISETGAGPCADGHALVGAVSIASSSDGKSLYVTANTGNALVRLNRNTTTGAITEPTGAAGCISETGAGPCANGHALAGPLWVAVSHDGKSVYAASHLSDAIDRINRNTTTGAITQPAGTSGCISNTGGGCTDGHALDGPLSIELSPNGKSAYAATLHSDAVVRFNRSL